LTSKKPKAIRRDASEAPDNKKQFVIGGVVVFVLIALGIAQVIMGSDKSEKATATVRHDMVRAEFEETDSTITKAKAKIKAKSRESALEEIARHAEAISGNWSAPDTPDRLIAMGNLYQYQLGDYYSAIERYRSVVDSYANHSKVPQAYIELAACYERMGDEVQAQYIYREMVESLDPSLQRVKYAKLKLGE